MSYHLYHTPAFVLAGTPFGEGNKRFTLLTRELGLLTASATSVRAERSKLRYGLQDFSLSDVTLVRGREFWRVTNAAVIENLYTTFRSAPEAVRMFGRVFGLLRRLVAGEEKHEELFATVFEAFSFLKVSEFPLSKGGAVPHFAAKWGMGDVKNPSPPQKAVLPFTKGELKQRDALAEIEIVLVLRILYLLGYLAPRTEFGTVLSDVSHWSDTLLSEARSFRSLALADINHSLRESQL